MTATPLQTVTIKDSIHGLHHRGRRALKQSLQRLDAVPVTG